MTASPTGPDGAAWDFDVSRWPELPRACGVFVTGTDTDVGKTIVAGAIARHLRRRGRAVEVFKPAATGCLHDRGRLISPDADFLAACAESKQTLAEISPVRYALALAPNAAARIERKPVDLDAIFQAWRRLAESADAVVVEGIGGLLCPITDEFWVVHLARMLRLPLIVVARAGLGTINHTLLTIHAARSAGIEPAGVIINRYRADAAAEPDVDWAMRTNPDQIARLGGVKVLTLVPDDPDNSVADARLAPSAQFAIDQAPWTRIVFG